MLGSTLRLVAAALPCAKLSMGRSDPDNVHHGEHSTASLTDEQSVPVRDDTRQ